MNRRLKKLIEEKAWETLTDYGYNDSQLLGQLTEAVLQRLGNQGYLKEQRQNVNEFFDWPLPVPPGAPRGGSWALDPATGRAIYMVLGPDGYMIYEIDGTVLAGPLSIYGGVDDPFGEFSRWFEGRQKLARRKGGKGTPGGTPDNPYYDDLSPTKAKPGFTPGGMGPNTGGPGPIDGGIFGN